VSVCAATAVGLGATIAWLLVLADIIDRVFLQGASLDDLGPSFGLLVGLLVLRSAATAGAEWFGARASAIARRQTRHRLATAVVSDGAGARSETAVGETASTLTDSVEALDPFFASYVPAVIGAVLGPPAVLLTILVLDPWTTLILLFAGPMLILILAMIGLQTRALTQQRHEELAWLTSFTLDMIRGLPTLRAFGRTAAGARALESASTRLASSTMDVLKTAFQTSLVMEWAATAATALVAVEVSFRLVTDNLTFGVALAVLVLTPEFFVPLRRLALEYHAGQTGRAAMLRISELSGDVDEYDDHAHGPSERHATEPEPRRNPAASGTPAVSRRPLDPELPAAGGQGAPTATPSISFDRVTFGYAASSGAVLHECTFTLAPGAVTALVGPSGAGKTTIAKLLLRLVEPVTGAIFVDGARLDEIDVAAWRRRIAWVPQQPTLLAGSVADNVRLGRPDASTAQVWHALREARLDAVIRGLPDGVETVLGEGGLRLSGGERQRLAIARAVLRDAPLVILDEMTAHLDSESESAVLRAAESLLRNRTALVISHRPQTIAVADHVRYIKDGVVVASNPKDVPPRRIASGSGVAT
jgi:ATP-binding cassette subfamily C protein CydD